MPRSACHCYDTSEFKTTHHHAHFPAAFLAVANEDFGRQIPFAFLERIQAEWRDKLADKARTAAPHSLDKTFGYVLEHCADCTVPSSKVRQRFAVVARWTWNRIRGHGWSSISPLTEVNMLLPPQSAVEIPHGVLSSAPRRAHQSCLGTEAGTNVQGPTCAVARQHEGT